MALAEINLHIIYALLQSDWLVQNLELELRNPGRSTHTHFSFPTPTHFPRACVNSEKCCWLARQVCVSVCICVGACGCVPASVLVCSSGGVGLRACV